MSILPWVWTATLAIDDTGVTFPNSVFGQTTKGAFTLDPSANPKRIDIVIPNDTGRPKLEGVYRLSGDRLDFCFARTPADPRPTDLQPGAKRVSVSLVRKKPGYDPTDVANRFDVTVRDADGKPVADATVTASATFTRVKGKETMLRDPSSAKSGPTGLATVPPGRFWQSEAVYVRHADRELVAVARVSPARLMTGLTLTLVPEVRIRGTLSSSELTKLGRPLAIGEVQLRAGGATMLLTSNAENGTLRYELPVPPGDWTLFASGYDAQRKDVAAKVPAGGLTQDFDLPATRFAAMKGQPVPEVNGIVGWKGDPLKLADLKGKAVVLVFFNHSHPQAAEIVGQVLALHDEYGKQGLAVVAVHISEADNEVDTAKAFDKATASAKKMAWGDRDLPFPVMLTTGKRESVYRNAPADEQFEVKNVPAVFLVDKGGKLVGHFSPSEKWDRELLEAELKAK